MEACLPERYTGFPDLDYGQEPIPAKTSVDWQAPAAELSIETIILSWASLLQSLTGKECPVFCANGEPVKADLSARSFERVNLDSTLERHGRYTGIFTLDSLSPPDGCAIAVNYSNRTGTITSFGCTTPSYLSQIGRQLASLIRRHVEVCPEDSLDVRNGLELSILNPIPSIYPGPTLLHDLIPINGRESDLAIEFLGQDNTRTSLSYGLLNDLTAKLSSRLIAALKSLPGPPRHDVVIPVLLPQSVDLYLAWLSILRAGAAVCPLNLDAPAERVNFVINDINADIVVTSKNLATKFQKLDRPVVIVHPDDVDASGPNGEIYDPREVQPHDLAYVMYTSGSTGLPKGVGISHLAATQALLAHDELIPPFRRFLQFAAPTFDVSVFEIFFPLFRGATLVSCERSLMLNDLPKVLRQLDVDAAELTPTVAGELVRKRDAVPSLKVLLTIGEMLTRHVIDEFGYSPDKDGILYGMYGPTEATIHCTIASKITAGSRVGNIGVPFKSVSAFVIPFGSTDLSHEGEVEVLPVGHIGELAVGGPQLANGYINREKENKKAFVDTRTYGRLYRTGDKARLLPNGELECLGRISSGQVKLRGQRVELGEIDHVISNVPGARNAAVLVVEGILVAFVLMEQNSLTVQDVHTACGKWLPKFMVPGDIVFCDEFPLLPSGKIDKFALQDDYSRWKRSQRTNTQDFEDDLEREVALCVGNILGSPVGKAESLAAVGLDSLNAIKLASALRRAGIKLDVLQILEADSIQQIGISARNGVENLLESATNEGDTTWDAIIDTAHNSLLNTALAANVQEILPCSPAQTAMLSETARNPKAYCNWIEVEFSTGITAPDVKSAIRALALKNEILRSGFIPIDHPGHSHAQLIWKELEESQFVECTDFNYDWLIDQETGLLHPLKVEVKEISGRIRAVLYLHHALYDGWSWDLILDDLADALLGKPLTLRPAYRTFTEYYMKHIGHDDEQTAISYWHDHLAGIKPSPLPNFNQSSDVPTRHEVLDRPLGIEIRGLDLVARKLLVARQTILQGAFAYLLSLYVGSSDIVFGSVFSGRTLPIDGIEDIIGPCIASLPLRIDTATVRNVRDLLATIHNLNRRALKHGFLPLRDIKQASGLDPSLSLFDALFVWQDTLDGNNSSSKLIQQVDAKDFLEFNLTLELGIRDQKVFARANFQQATIPASQVDIFLSQLEAVASLFIQDPTLLLQDVNSHLSEHILSAENPVFTKQVGLPSLSHSVEVVARSDPERVAIEFLESFDPDTQVSTITRLNYADLDRRSNQLVTYLRSLGLVAGDLIAIFLEKSIDLYIAILAVIKAGAGYVPITPQTPIMRVNTIVNEAKCRICVTNSTLSQSLGQSTCAATVLLDWSTLSDLSTEALEAPVSDASIAYAVFTSGSTGTPKGVLITHRNLQSNIAILSEIYPTFPVSKLLQACSHAFDVSVFEIFYAWDRGMSLCSTTNDVLFRDIEQTICLMDITHLSLTPTVAALVNPDNVPKVRFLVTAGEAITPKVLNNWASRGLYQGITSSFLAAMDSPGLTIYVLGYGPSETTNICTVKPNLVATDFINIIGKPFKNTSAFVASESDTFSLIPRGAVGEFCFGGEQVGAGYLNMPEITGSKFINHLQYGRVYRSGDYGRMLPDGSLAFTGRRDDQVKIRGQRVELTEIDQAIIGHPSVKDCTTIIAEVGKNGVQQLVSFWVTTASSSSLADEFRRIVVLELFEHIRGVLPPYMVPSMLILIGVIPLTGYGKTDKRELLRHLDMMERQSSDLYSCAREVNGDDRQLSDTEAEIVQALSEVTGAPIGDIGLYTSFYQLGLDSISAVSLSRRLKLAGLGQVDISTIMRHSSVETLSRAIKSTRRNDMLDKYILKLDSLFSDDVIEIAKRDIENAGNAIRRVLPCTPLQEAMLSRKSANNSTAYYNNLIFEVAYDADIIRGAWNTLMKRHDILRTCFVPTSDARFAFAQVVLDAVEMPWKSITASNDEIQSAIEKQKSDVQKSTETLVPYAFTLFENTDNGMKLLLLSIHHALYDAEAMTQLLVEAEMVSLGKELPPAVPFDLYLEEMVSLDTKKSDSFWCQYLSDMPSMPLVRTDLKHPTSFGSTSVDLKISLSGLLETCKSLSSTLLSLFQTVWAKLLVCYLERSDICFGNVFSCRNQPIDGVERIVGPCFNTLPVRVKVSPSARNIDMMQDLLRCNTDIIPYQLTSLRRLQSNLRKDGTRLFDTLVLLQSGSPSLNENIWKLVDEDGDMDFPIVCEITQHRENDKIQVCLHHDRSLVSSKDAEGMLGELVVLLDHVLEYPSARVDDSSVLEQAIPSFVERMKLEYKSRETVYGNHVNGETLSSREWSPEAIQVREVLSTLSKIDPIHIEHNTTIFQLGLDSINAVQLSASLRSKGYEISATDILEAPSVASITSCLQQPRKDVSRSSPAFDFGSFQSKHWPSVCREIEVPESYIESIRPCTPIQAGMLALFISSDEEYYFNHLVLKSATPLEIPSLKKAWMAVVDRHEMLRVGFVQVADEKFPFAMITYHKGAYELPWCERTYLEANQNSLALDRAQIAKQTLSQLHRPPWLLTVEQCESHTLLQFSALHALYDAQSLNLILEDVYKLYRGEILPSPIPIQPVQDLILSEGLSNRQECEKFWRTLGEGLHNTKFPDVNPIETTDHGLSVLSRPCSKRLDFLQDRCRRANVTLQAAGQAAWAKLLSSYIGQSGVTFGLVLSGRGTSDGFQDAVFPCLTTVPSHYNLEGSNDDLLQRIMTLNASLMRWQFTPLSKILSWTGTNASLFDTLFVFQKLPSSTTVNDLWDIKDEQSSIEYPVSIELIPSLNALVFRVTFNSNILPQEQANLLLDQLDWLLLDTLSSLDAPCNTIPPVGSSLISALPAKEAKIPSSVELLHNFVEVNAQERPSRVALEFAYRSPGEDLLLKKWTYKELNEAANQYSHLLQQHGASTGQLIGICLDKCPEAYISILAILKLGCAYVALDPGAPIARKQFIMEDSGAKLLLCASTQSSELKTLSGIDIIVMNELKNLDDMPCTPASLARPIQPDDTCYCLYTSGTTGTPKGCEITHSNAVQAMLAFQRLFHPHWDETSRWLQFASFHFDVSVLEQYWSWSVGICVTSCPRDILFEDLAGTIQKLEITHIDLTPSLAKLLHPDDVPSLCRGVFITGGEALRQEIVDAWGPRGVIYNGYGPTEVTIGCTMLPRVSQYDKPSNIGPQFDNVGSFVFRPGTNIPVLRGGVGELCVSGALVGRGYLNRPQLTAERFQRIEELGERVYRTGDLVRVLHDGSFCFLGRIDDQIKLRGQRLEVGEVNDVIARSAAGVREVVTAVMKRSEQSEDHLVSFVTLGIAADGAKRDVSVDFSDKYAIDIQTVKQACCSSLPGYMVPTHVIPLSAIPLSANNKIDYPRLKSIYAKLSLDDIQKLSRQPREGSLDMTPEVNKVISIIATMTESEVGSISPWNSVFELGLDSISVISFARALREAGFDAAQPSLVVKNSTVLSLSKALRASSSGAAITKTLQQAAKQTIAAFAHTHLASVAEELRLSLDDIEGVAPCTPLQEGMISRSLESNKPIYFSNFNFELSSKVDVPRLKSSWLNAQVAVQVLRTKFPLTTSGYVQATLKEDHFPWFEICVENDTEIDNVSQSRYAEWCTPSTRLVEKVWEVGTIAGPAKRWMCLNIFHALYDGSSLPVLLEKVSEAYENQSNFANVPPFLEVLPFGPLHKVPGAESFWTQHLEDIRPGVLPRIKETEDPTSISTSLEIQGLDGLETLRRRLCVTEQAVFLACWLQILKQQFGFTPTIGVIVSGRAIDFNGVNDVIGPMFNTLPCSMASSKASSSYGLIQDCHAYYGYMLQFQHTPLRDIMKWMGWNSGVPLFESLFVFQRQDGRGSGSSEKLWSPVPSYGEPDYPLAFEAERNEAGVSVSIVAQDHILTRESAEDLVIRFKDLLLKILETDTDISDPSSNPSAETAVIFKGLPTTANGHLPDDDRPFEWTSVAVALREEIAALANVDINDIHPTTSIFEIGLDSIDAIKLSSRLNKGDIRLPVSAIMRGRNIEAMMAHIASSDGGVVKLPAYLDEVEEKLLTWLEKEGCDMTTVENILPATPLQEAMVADMVASDYHHYFNHDILEIETHVNMDKLKEAWIKVVKTHPILRTSFIEVGDPSFPFTYAQLVQARGSVLSWKITSMSGKPISYFVEKARREVMTDFSKAPLLRFEVLHEGETRLLLFSITHAMYDGWSLDLLHQDVARSYNSQSCLRPTYRGVLERIVSPSDEASQKFWRGTLRGVRPVPFPKQQHSVGNASVIHRQEKILSTPRVAAASFCKSQGVTLQVLGLTCWSLVLAGYLGKLDVVFGTIASGRDVPDAEQVIFPTMNSIAIRAILHGSRYDMLKYIQDLLVAVGEHQHFPLRKAKALADIGNQSLFDTLFIYQKSPPGEDTQSIQWLYRSTSSVSDVEYPVCVEMEVIGESLLWRIACKDTIMGEQDATELLERIQFVLEEILTRSEQPTLDFTDDGISICLSPQFRDSDTDDDTSKSHRVESTDVEWTKVEEDIRSVLASVSNIPVEQISRQTTIYHLGLDSISAIKVSSLLRKERSILLTVGDMLRALTVPDMAQLAKCGVDSVADKQQHNADSIAKQMLANIEVEQLLKDNRLEVEEVERVIPATSGQVYMLSMHRNSNGQLYFPAFRFRVEGNLGQSQLEDGWHCLTSKLSILRTRFIRTGGQHVPYLQVVLKEAVNPVVWGDDLDQVVQQQGNTENIKASLATLYALQGPDTSTTIMLHIHHVLYDAVSIPRMLEALALYCENVNSEVETGVDISELIAFNNVSSPIEQREHFWKTYLGDYSESIEGDERQRRAERKWSPTRVKRYTPSLIQDVDALEKLSRTSGISIQALFLAAYAKVHLKTMSNTTDLVVGIYLANRSHDLHGLPGMIAPTVNIVPLRIKNPPGTSVLNLAQAIQTDLHEIGRAENSCVSLLEIAQWTGVTLDTFVNFLKLPDAVESAHDNAQRSIHFVPVEDNTAEVNRTQDNEKEVGVGRPDQNGTGLPREVYMPGIDIEAAVRDNSLAVGIFGSIGQIDMAAADRILDELRLEIVGILES
ncbi:hypothetical protein AJ80_04621 [Polytolypa hystricis UAMH7299]|uniref:Nonribosomal peptide synthetase sidC n=1 Tax=Polytolypa hystricis (strain UAMH7299) TaxID=1447883 RepID=A0A2B7Y9X5_POLH7|nr:hypothetical protein AJ80_04621 [Polytolypa hystricis UAMH7299]